MARQHHYRVNKEPPDLDITSFLNLMVVLVPFLLITAVFSRITILQLNLPEGSGSSDAKEQKLTIEVIVRKDAIELGDGKQIFGRLPNTEDGNYDIAQLSNILLDYKRKAPDKRDAIILMEADLHYAVLVKIMDAVSTVAIVDDEGQKTNYDLFPQISIGDAPVIAAPTAMLSPEIIMQEAAS
jgi:biopolymer transport protein ExbD